MNETKMITTEEQLRTELEKVRQELALERKHQETGLHRARRGPSAGLMISLAVVLLALVIAGFFVGYLPRLKRDQVLAAEVKTTTQTLPVVLVKPVTRSESATELVLPGNIQPVTEAPVLARASGYIKKRYADIGDRVKEGQVLAEVEAPELDQQILQAEASLQQAQSTVEQAEAALEQGRSNENLARVTAERWQKLVDRGAVSRQENDVYQAQWTSQKANVQALQKGVNAATSSMAAVRANLARLREMGGYKSVRAPFAGVITVRNVDTGALVNEGNTMLFRIAQTDRMRTYINVPQSEADAVHVGQTAQLEVPGLTRKLAGKVSRTSNSLDPASRTLLTEIEVPNADGTLLPGTFTQVDLMVQRRDPPLVITSDTLVVRSNGPQVAVLNGNDEVHFTPITLGRDFGDHMEVLTGLELGQRLVVNPSDQVREGVKVKPTQPQAPATSRKS